LLVAISSLFLSSLGDSIRFDEGLAHAVWKSVLMRSIHPRGLAGAIGELSPQVRKTCVASA